MPRTRYAPRSAGVSERAFAIPIPSATNDIEVILAFRIKIAATTPGETLAGANTLCDPRYRWQ